MSFVKEFKEFAMKGNVIDMAVGIIIGAKFGEIVSSIVKDVITPPLGLLLGGVDFRDLKFILKSAEGAAPAVTLNYGMFLQNIFDFTIIAFAIFLVIKGINTFKRNHPTPEAPPAPPSNEEKLLGEIRDLLRIKN